MNKAIVYIRVTAMLTIVFCHCLFYYGIWKFFPDATIYFGIEYWRTIGLIAVNAFVFISGYLFAYLYIKKGKYRNTHDFIKKKILRILVPYCFWGIIAIILFPGEHPINDYFTGIQHLWFLLMLFGIFIIARGFINILLKQKSITQCFIFLGILLANQIVTKFIDSSYNYFAWMKVLEYLPAFIIGVYMVQYEWYEKITKQSSKCLYIGLVISLILVIIIAIVPSWPFGMLYMDLPTYSLFVFSFVVLNKSIKGTICNYVQSLDNCSYGIYIIHHLLIWAFLVYIPSTHSFMNEHYILAPVILFFTVLSLSWIFTIAIRSNKYTSPLIGA